MEGLNHDAALSLIEVLDRAERVFPDKRVRAWDGGHLIDATHGEVALRARRVVAVLRGLGVPAGEPVATLAHNTIDHVVLSLAVPCGGWVFHPLNPRLHLDDLAHVVERAGDRILVAERSLAEVASAVVERCPQLSTVVWIDEPGPTALPDHVAVHRLDDLLGSATAVDLAELAVDDERQAAVLSFTTGTTERPKGVAHSHRAVFLSVLSLATADSLGAAESDVILAVGPLYHANGLNLPYAALGVGADLVLPGRSTDSAVLAELIEGEGVTATITIPVIVQQVLPHLAGRDLHALRRIIIGSSACPPPLLAALRSLTGPDVVLHGFGMTETQPPSLVSWQRTDDRRPPDETARAVGIPVLGVSCRIVHDDGTPVEPDGVDAGELQLRGPWIIDRYLGEPEARASTDDGWLHTGDRAVVDRFGLVTIVDRTKDLIKSGGLWISSTQLEALLGSLDGVDEVAVVGREDPRWGERPVAVVALRPGATVTLVDVHRHLDGSVATWAVPDALVVVDRLPRTATAKIDKQRLRTMVEDADPSSDEVPG